MERKIDDKQLGRITIRESARATRYTLKISRGEIEGIIPIGGSEKRMLHFIEENRAKLLASLKRHPAREILSDKLELQTFSFSLHIFRIDRSGFYMSLQGGVLHIACPEKTNFEDERVQKVLLQLFKKALRHEACRLLPDRLKQLANLHGFNFSDIKITGSRTSWGSCTGRKSINLSYNLMLLPAHLIDYVLLHELCHTKEMNHSARFWKILDEVTGNKALALRKELKNHHPW